MQNSPDSPFMNHSRMPLAKFFPIAVLENGINIIEGDLLENQNSDENATEKARIDKRLKQFQVILRSHILKEYTTYFGNKDGYKEWSDKFFNLLYELDFDNDYLSKRMADRYLEKLEIAYKAN